MMVRVMSVFGMDAVECWFDCRERSSIGIGIRIRIRIRGSNNRIRGVVDILMGSHIDYLSKYYCTFLKSICHGFPIYWI